MEFEKDKHPESIERCIEGHAFLGSMAAGPSLAPLPPVSSTGDTSEAEG